MSMLRYWYSCKLELLHFSTVLSKEKAKEWRLLHNHQKEKFHILGFRCFCENILENNIMIVTRNPGLSVSFNVLTAVVNICIFQPLHSIDLLLWG
jgi:hypothetical protein